MRATALAHPNIALVKYWGKRDDRLILPHQPSLSMTLVGLSARTTVEFEAQAREDSAEIDGRPLVGAELARIVETLDRVRARAALSRRARVASRTDFPKAAGLASSAAGGAALAAAASWAAGLSPSARELSVLARRNSGSACRSIEGGFCEWLKGEAADGADSYAVQVASEAHWPELRMVVAICSDGAKKVSSREAMRRTVETSPYYPAWVGCAQEDLAEARAALLARDLPRLGAVAESNAWRMHAAAMAARPPINYLRPTTVAVIAAVEELRSGGVDAYFTLDAGPNPCVVCSTAGLERVIRRLSGVSGVMRTLAGGPGQGVQRLEER